MSAPMPDIKHMAARAAQLLVGPGLGTADAISGKDAELRRSALLTIIVCYAGVVLSVAFAPMALVQGHWVTGGIEIGFGALLAVIGVCIRQFGYHQVLSYIGGASSGAMFLYLLAVGGGGGSGHIWSLTFPLFALFILGARRGAAASGLLLASIALFFVFEEQLALAPQYSAAFKARWLAGYGLVLSFSYFFERTRATAQGRLAEANRDLEQRVAELRVTDEARRETETLLKATLESTGDGILVVNTEGQVITTNDQFSTMWRLPNEVLVAGEEDALTAYLSDQLADPESLTAHRGGSAHEEETSAPRVLQLSDGRVFEQKTAPLIVDGVVKGYVWWFRDVTEQARAKQERDRLQAALQRSQKMEALGKLAGGVAHDLNNVLAGIVGYPDMLLKELPEDSSLRGDLTAIRASGTKAALIVQDLLTLARRGVSNKTVLNLNDVIRGYLKSPEHERLLSFHSKATLHCQFADDLLNISGSSVHLTKTVMNLVSNAAEAMPDGGEIRISTSNRYVDTPVLGYDSVKEGEYVLLSVSDSGVGIPPESLDRIFEPFYTSKTMGRSGSGLGLAVIWSTVKDLDGYIDVRTQPGKGTVFTLYFPATREEVELEQTPAATSYRGNGESVLVVDDMPEQREIATRALSALGYRVTSVASGEEAIEYLEQHEADLLVLDMIMPPGLDGLDTYKRILEHHPRQRAIVASGYSETGRVREAQALGAREYIRKPYLLEQIGVAVKRALASR